MKKIKGVILSGNSKYIILLTPEGEFVKIPARDRIYRPGTEIEAELPSAGKIKKFALVAGIFFLLSIGMFFNLFDSSMRAEAYLALDINPSILLSLDDNATVIKAEALNDEGEEILKNIELKKQNALEAIKLILQKARENNFLTTENNEIFISLAAPDNYVITEKEIKSCIFEQILEMGIDSYLKISRAGVQQAAEAQKKRISLNGMLLYNELAAKGIFNKEDKKEVKEQSLSDPPVSVKEITGGVNKEKIFDKDDFIPGNKASIPNLAPPASNKTNSKAFEKRDVFKEETKETNTNKEEEEEEEEDKKEKPIVDKNKTEKEPSDKKNNDIQTKEKIISGKKENIKIEKGKENVSSKGGPQKEN